MDAGTVRGHGRGHGCGYGRGLKCFFFDTDTDNAGKNAEKRNHGVDSLENCGHICGHIC